MKISRTRALVIVAVTLAMAAGVTVWVTSEPAPRVLDHSWGSPAVVGGIANAESPIDLFAEAIAGSDEILELGGRNYDVSALTPDALKAAAEEMNPSGTVPGWMPVVEGAAPLGLSTQANPAESGGTEYVARMTSVVATDKTAAGAIEVIRDAEGEWLHDSGIYDTSVEEQAFTVDDRPDPEADLPPGGSSLHVGVEHERSVPGLLFIDVTARYTIPGPVQLSPDLSDRTVTNLQTLAGTQGWSLSGWDVTDMVGQAPQRSVDWTVDAGKSAVEAAELITGSLGLPLDGDADDGGAWLDYDNGNVQLVVDGAMTTLTWTPEQPRSATPAAAVDLGVAGVPLLSVDLGSEGPVDAGRGTPTAAQDIARFGQLGMIAIDNATATVVSNSSSIDLPVTGTNGEAVVVRQATMWTLIDTTWSVAEVVSGLDSALQGVNFDLEIGPSSTGYGFDGEATQLTLGSAYSEPLGRPWYLIEVGKSLDHPGLIEVRIEVGVELTGSLPAAPAGWNDYFAAPMEVAAAEDWTQQRWYLVEGLTTTGGALYRGEMDWTTPDRGEEGLSDVVSLLTEVSGVAPTRDGLSWFEGEDDWAANFGKFDGRYSPVEVLWEGRSINL